MNSQEIPIPSVEDITHRTHKVSYADNRLDIVLPQCNTNAQNLMLIGKIFFHRNFYAQVILEIVLKAWRPSRPVQVKKVERNIFMFTFENEADLTLAFNRRPWTIRGAHLNLKMWNLELSWKEIGFSLSAFWVQVHGLPPSWFNKEYVELIGGKVGRVLEVDLIAKPRILWQRFVCCRINIDITTLLWLGMFLPRKD